jgi:hypothetical protein
MDTRSTNRENEAKKTYRTPKLTVHGTLTELTRGEHQQHTDGFWSGGKEDSSTTAKSSWF